MNQSCSTEAKKVPSISLGHFVKHLILNFLINDFQWRCGLRGACNSNKIFHFTAEINYKSSMVSMVCQKSGQFSPLSISLDCFSMWTSKYEIKNEKQKEIKKSKTMIIGDWFECKISKSFWVLMKVGGWTEVYEGLTFATVRGAGHEVPLFKPRAALQLFKSFIKGEPLPKSWIPIFMFLFRTRKFCFLFPSHFEIIKMWKSYVIKNLTTHRGAEFERSCTYLVSSLVTTQTFCQTPTWQSSLALYLTTQT